MAVWENVHACDIVGNCIDAYLVQYVQHLHKIQPAETNRSALSQRSLSSDLLAQTSMKMVMGTYLLYLR